MISRSNMPSLMRKRGGTVKRNDGMTNEIKKNTGSLTHKSMYDEPPLKAMKAKRSQIKDGLARNGSGPNFGMESGSVSGNARLIKSRKGAGTFKEPMEFGPNNAKSAPRQAFKKGGEVDAMWIQSAIKNPGALRKTLHVKAGEKIPMDKLEKAEHSKNPTTRRRARLAETLRGFHH
jgi:hypothetical protein